MTAAQSRLAAFAIVAIAIAASAFAYMSWRQSQVSAFAASAKAALANVDLVLDRALLTVRAAQGLYASRPEASEGDLTRFVEGMGPVLGLRSLVYHPRVSAEGRAAFEAGLQRSGKSTSGIWIPSTTSCDIRKLLLIQNIAPNKAIKYLPGGSRIIPAIKIKGA